MRFWVWWLWALLAGSLLPSVASAEGSRVVLVEPQRGDAVILAAFMRLQGELAASGFQVLIVRESDAGTSPRMLADVAREQGAFASISIIRSGEATTADVWISDRLTGKTSIRTIATRRPDAPDLLAVRAADLLRVSLQEYGSEPPPLDVVSAEPSATKTPEIEAWTLDQSASAGRWELVAGGQFLGSFSELGLGAGPMMGMGLKPDARWLARVLVFGPTPTPAWRASEGVVRLRQEVLAVEGGWAPVAGSSAAFHLLLGTGVYHMSAMGEAKAPLESRTDSVWTVAAMPGMMGSLAVSAATSVELAVWGVVPLQRPGVKMGNSIERHQAVMVIGELGLAVRL